MDEEKEVGGSEELEPAFPEERPSEQGPSPEPEGGEGEKEAVEVA